MFKKILIANRGEIACRVIRTARTMGIATVAVYSEADRNARHVELADEAVAIGPPPSKQSYLDAERIVAACRQTGAQAVHPGYGFLSENAAFCARLESEGIVFIGPKAESIRAMGDKIASKRLAAAAKVPTIPGYTDVIEDAEQAQNIARGIGYPVMIKASAGGGGKGLRVAWNDAECREGFASCHNEARNAFGDDRVFIEKFIVEPRHIEIQLLGDAHGKLLYLWERECSIQRRHQKVIEEAPSPLLDEAMRRAMGEQACALARAVNYQSAGTVEFVVDQQRRFYFLEMNTRLQVEHPVTEMITGLDLVEWMIRIAAGEPLTLKQEQLKREGWALECRINAEDPARGFLPSTGRLVRFVPPQERAGEVRIDTGVYEGDEIPIYYDSMIGKLITHGRDRAQAVARMREALNRFVVRGISTNIAFQAALMRNARFLEGRLHTGLIAEDFPNGYNLSTAAHPRPLLVAAVAAYARGRYVDRAGKISGQLRGHGRKVGSEWVVLGGGESIRLRIEPNGSGCDIVHLGQRHTLRTDWQIGQILFEAHFDDEPVCLQFERHGVRYRIGHDGVQLETTVLSPRAAELLALMPQKELPDLSRFLLSPMPGLLVEIAVKPGQEVKAGERLATIEAMKMENILRAERDGVVEEQLATAGESVAVDQPILRFR
ncbi:MAG TPA: acetyl-CoA carboxylase biotin carboxylase subunit [Burkholderiaceae bacterium]|jgi:propionyl-CoA carboxylase alpha chain|nr:acetyl-CoA carboxylase biotin carboxylase subunit [Burkholderiaceae bacterium]